MNNSESYEQSMNEHANITKERMNNSESYEQSMNEYANKSKDIMNRIKGEKINELVKEVPRELWTPDDDIYIALYNTDQLKVWFLALAQHDSPVIRFLKRKVTGGRKSKRQRLRRSKSRRSKSLRKHSRRRR